MRCDKTTGRKIPVDCKYKTNVTKERYKDQLATKEFTQAYGSDYTETFTPITKLNIIQVLLSLITNLD